MPRRRQDDSDLMTILNSTKAESKPKKSNEPKKKPKPKKADELEQAPPPKLETGTVPKTGVITFQAPDQGTGKKAKSKRWEIQPFKLENFTVRVAGRVLIENGELSLQAGKYGLVGYNGQGKSTLVRHINEREIEDIPDDMDILLVEQEITASQESVYDAVIKSDKRRLEVLGRIQEIEDYMATDMFDPEDEEDPVTEELEELYEECRFNEYDRSESEIRRILRGLGFSIEDMARPTADFSGGWRMRVALAQALFRKPTLLMLDEPSNHLDLEAAMWLTSYLHSWKKILILVTHDVDLLEDVCEHIIHVHEGKLRQFKGNYQQFVRQRAQELQELRKKYNAQQKQITEMKKKNKKNLSKEAIEKSIKDLIECPPQDYRVNFMFMSPETINGNFVEMSDIDFSYNPKSVETSPYIIKKLDFGLCQSSRIAIVGKNGSGKSTFLKLLVGRLSPTDGYVRINPRIKMSYYSQHFDDFLDYSQTAVEFFQTQYNVEPAESRKLLGRFGLSGKHHVMPMERLSGGQKARVVYASIFCQEPDIIVLDEPTNHLDVDSIEALIQAINEFNGAVVIVTHSTYLIESTECQLYCCRDQNVLPYDGDIDDYRDEILAEIE